MNVRAMRLILFLVKYLTSTAPLRSRLKTLARTDPAKSNELAFASVQKAFNDVLRICNVDLTVEGIHNIPDQPVLFVGNHTSYFDIVTLGAVSPRPIGFVAKQEILKVPGLASWMKLIHCLFLDRKNIKQGLETIMAGVDNLKQGYSMGIYPEGTRSETGELLEFHAGSLKMAQRAKAPVVPVAVSGTRAIYEDNKGLIIKPSSVHISFGEPFVITDLPPKERKYAADYTKKAIQELLDNQNK